MSANSITILDSHGETLTNGKPLSTSGKTKMYSFPQFVLKLFPIDQKIENEVNALKKIQSTNIIKMIGSGPNFIIYERITPLKTIINPNKDKLIDQLCQIASALYIIHSNGYIHGDVAIGSIGINNSGNYLLYDFETTKEDKSDEARFKDVEMFLEDFIIQYKESVQLQSLLTELLGKLKTKHTETKLLTRKMPSGKMKELPTITYHYNPKDFGELLLNEYGKKCKIIQSNEPKID